MVLFPLGEPAKPSPAGRRLERGDWLGATYSQLALGDNDAALASLERSFEQRHSWLPFLKVDPALAPLRGEPRFGELLRRVGL